MTTFETIKTTLSNGNTFEYAKVNDTYYKLSKDRVSKFHVETMRCRYIDGVEYPYQVMQCTDNKEVVNIANFKKEKSALHYIQFMEGTRYAK